MLVCMIPSLVETGDGITFSYSVYGVGIFAILLWVLNRYWKTFWQADVWKKIITGILSFGFLSAMTLGKMLDRYGYLNLAEGIKFLAPLVGMPFLSMVIYHTYQKMEKILTFAESSEKITKKENLIYALFLFICWGIVLLGVYPGFFVYDAVDEVNEVITRGFTTHHPLFHVLYLGGIVQAGYKIFGSYNMGIFLFTLFQMVIFIAGIIYVVNKMRSFGFHRNICRGMIAFMGLFPVYPMIALCSCKDSLFALFVLLWVTTTYEVLRQPEKYCRIKWIFCSVMLCLLRNNAIYALLVTGVVFLIFEKKHRKVLLVLLGITLVITTLFSKGVAGILNADRTEHQEMLTVPIQQLTRTYQLSKEVFTEEETQTLHKYLPEEYLNRYKPKLSDGVKIGFQNEEYAQNPADFWKLWVSVGSKAPVSYLNAWLMTSYGFWYPDTVVDVYKGNTVYTFTYQDNSYFGFETEEPGYRESKIPLVNEWYRKLSLEIYKEKMPVVSQLFLPGFMFWILIFVMGYMVMTRGWKSIMPYCFLLFVIATLILGPTYLPRYVFFLWMTIPFILGDLCNCRR